MTILVSIACSCICGKISFTSLCLKEIWSKLRARSWMSLIRDEILQGTEHFPVTLSIIIFESPSTWMFLKPLIKATCRPARRAKASAQMTLVFPTEFEAARIGWAISFRRINPAVAEESAWTEPSKFNFTSRRPVPSDKIISSSKRRIRFEIALRIYSL